MGRFCVERVKFVKFGEREGGGVRREELGVDWAAKPLRLRGRSPREKPPLSKGGAERKRGGGIPGRLRI